MRTTTQYKHFLLRIMKYYNITKKEAQNCLFKAYMDFLSIDELEEYIIPIQEMKLNLSCTR